MKTINSIISVTVLSLFLLYQPVLHAQSPTDSEPANAITIVEYGDYQCPACKTYHGFLQKLQGEFDDKLTVKFYHFPLQTHAYAGLAARAAEAARNQGKFKEMHNMLFENQSAWSNSSARATIRGFARELELDMEQFNEDWHSMETFNKVREDKKAGKKRQVRGTPTLYIGETEIPLPMNYEQLKEYIAERVEAS